MFNLSAPTQNLRNKKQWESQKWLLFRLSASPLCWQLFSLAGVPIMFAAETQPIRSVALGGIYHLDNSVGDEWAPTWADDGNLYSANDDGHGLSKTAPTRCIAFSKLAGNNPYNLRGAREFDDRRRYELRR